VVTSAGLASGDPVDLAVGGGLDQRERVDKLGYRLKPGGNIDQTIDLNINQTIN
jgi:hypothetical protein